ncbi:MAG: hypothetical protein Q9227_002345 [Pyrenula ochraceoflavens]
MPQGLSGGAFPQPNYMANAMRQQQQQQQPQNFPNQNDSSAATGPSPRRGGPAGGHIRGPSTNIPPPLEITLEEEEDVSRGDIMDFMTPREIAKTRYCQHHNWMEEIFASPYPTKSLVPSDLGLGRKGELESLTRGFFEAPTSDGPVTATGDKAGADGDDDAWAKVGKMKRGKAEEFQKRADNLYETTQAEIRKMNQSHERRMKKLKKTMFYLNAAKKLENAPFAAEKAQGDTRETYEDIVAQVEDTYAVKIDPLNELEPVTVQKGGLLDDPVEIAPPNGNAEDGGIGLKEDDADMGGMDETTATTNPPQPQQQGDQQPQAALSVSTPQPELPEDNDAVLPELEDLQADTEMAGLDSEPAPDPESQLAAADDWVLVNDTPSKPTSEQQTPAAATAAAEASTEPEQPPSQPAENTPQPPPATGLTPAATGEPEQPADTTPADLGADFDISANFDSAGDALDAYGQEHGGETGLDLEDIGMGDLDDSAFGQAFHPPEEEG